jgi:DNA topoisomerase VI subunit B
MSDDIDEEFSDAVNMTARELEKWLGTKESKESGQHKGGGESTGHESGRHIVAILQKKKSDITDEERSHMHKVVGYIKRHSAQRPSGDVRETTWRYSLMNWGHDPLK